MVNIREQARELAFVVWRYALPLFRFRALGQVHRYFTHPYNWTWKNERAVELPIAFQFLREHGHGRGLEVGNVLSHYVTANWTIIDKYEEGAGVSNCDILDHRPEKLYDFIVSISTLEHVGWDEEDKTPGKCVLALHHLYDSLASGGRMLITAPFGYNRYLDDTIRSRTIAPEKETFLFRRLGNRWKEGPAQLVPYHRRRWFARSVWIGEFRR